MAEKLSERLEREAARTVQWQTLHGGGPITKQANPTHVVNLLREAAELARRVEWLRENPHVRVDQFGGKYRASTAAQILTDWLSSYDAAIDAAIAAANGGENG